MTDHTYLPDLDDGDFRRLIDARRLVIIKFWSSEQGEQSGDNGAFVNLADIHPEIAFAQSNVDLHQGLALRTHAPETPSLQGWVDGNLALSRSGELTEEELEAFILQIKQHEQTH